jgi:UrcA family protein
MTKLLLAAAAALAIASPALAHADDAATPIQARIVSAQDVNFSDPASADHFYVKLWQAALDVCFVGAGITRPSEVDQSCVRTAMAQAVESVNRPLLTAAYERTWGDDARVYAASAR